MATKLPATEIQKRNFIASFAEIVKDNVNINGKYSIKFFDAKAKTNYVISRSVGKSMNILEILTVEEALRYKALKTGWIKYKH